MWYPECVNKMCRVVESVPIASAAVFTDIIKGGRNMQTTPIFVVIAYMAIMMGIGFYVAKKQIKDSKDYMIAGRRMGISFSRIRSHWQ